MYIIDVENLLCINFATNKGFYPINEKLTLRYYIELELTSC